MKYYMAKYSIYTQWEFGERKRLQRDRGVKECFKGTGFL
jgi:hypothetical protein